MSVYRTPTPEQMGQVLSLRWNTLRDQSLPMDDTITDEYDTDPDTVHGIMYQQQFGGLIVATGRIHTPRETPEVRQIRYMATRAGRQGEGLGAQLLVKMEREVVERPSAVRPERFEANARTSALKFYINLGYVVVSDEFELVDVPHVKIEKQIH